MKYFYLIALVTSISINAQTTLTEYNYLTKGYALDLETGRDIKKGYVIERLDGTSSRVRIGKETIDRAVHLFAFKKEGQKKPVALLAKFIRLDSKKATYICIPSPKSDKDLLFLAEEDFLKLNNTNEDNINAVHYFWNTLKLLGNAYMN
ncbi:hypothetical protein [Algibacter sp. PT7-4]|uniref:hypothetical protein n=1 Tax=Algibacter ulvanivorans TaxID=3400999 RepID=UPI003AAEA267